ncbi:uncharacterized protein TRIVIDRAFT_129816, partial [Trichoderma virens Gv29-8]
CGREGRPDMYGLGIRLGIYLQWFGEILVEFFDEADVSDIRLLGLLLSGAIALALLVEIVDQNVQAADIYIVLQLAGGSYIFLAPMYVWRALTCCDRKWDPLKWTREIYMPVYGVSTMMLMVIISALQLWFFSTYMPTKGRHCDYYGFFFTKVRLDNVAFIVKHLLRTMRSISNVVVCGLHITAIELTIRWNQFDNIDGVNTSGQTIPLLVSIGILIR